MSRGVHRRRPTAGAALLAGLAILALAGPWLAPHDPRASPDPGAAVLLGPGEHRFRVRLADGSERLAESVRRDGESMLLERLGRVETWPAAALSPGVPIERRAHWLGTDRLGRDVLSRLLDAGRFTLGIACAAAAVSIAVGIAIGTAAGLGGRLIGAALDRLLEIFLAFPPLLLALAVAAAAGGGGGGGGARAGGGGSLLAVIAVLAATSWMSTARLVRGELRSLREREFVVAARAIGLSPARLFFRHLLPHLGGPLRIDAALRLADLALAESALSFLGFGVQPPRASWGGLLADGRDEFLTAWWTTLPAGLLITLLALAAHLLGEHWRRRADPRHADPGHAAPPC